MGNYIKHFGIKGMKWGIRRYQNEDGTLTAEGKARRESRVSHDRMPIKKMTDAELDARTKRLQKEQFYRNLRDQSTPLRRGKTSIKKNLGKFGTTVFSIAVTSAAAAAGKKYVEHLISSGSFSGRNIRRKAASVGAAAFIGFNNLFRR